MNRASNEHLLAHPSPVSFDVHSAGDHRRHPISDLYKGHPLTLTDSRFQAQVPDLSLLRRHQVVHSFSILSITTLLSSECPSFLIRPTSRHRPLKKAVTSLQTSRVTSVQRYRPWIIYPRALIFQTVSDWGRVVALPVPDPPLSDMPPKASKEEIEARMKELNK